MRLRKVKNAKERLMVDDNKYFIEDATKYKGKWHELFNNDNPIHIEIGCGKGRFIETLSELNKDINYIAIEKFDSVLLRALEKVIDKDIPNLKLACLDASILDTYFSFGEVDRIYLNFSDPWPKSHHAKRRLTHENFLKVYDKVLSKDGEIFFMTDNRHLFEFSLESFNSYGLKMSHISLDLHNDLEKYPDNIETEFEEKWSKLGPIYRVEVRRK